MVDFLNGAKKVKRLMNNKTVFVCRNCGMSHDKFNKADMCCKKVNRFINKSGQPHQKWRNKNGTV